VGILVTLLLWLDSCWHQILESANSSENARFAGTSAWTCSTTPIAGLARRRDRALPGFAGGHLIKYAAPHSRVGRFQYIAEAEVDFVENAISK
jgi:hypothetical protein